MDETLTDLVHGLNVDCLVVSLYCAILIAMMIFVYYGAIHEFNEHMALQEKYDELLVSSKQKNKLKNK
jgi:hypothetical protein